MDKKFKVDIFWNVVVHLLEDNLLFNHLEDNQLKDNTLPQKENIVQDYDLIFFLFIYQNTF